MSHEPLTLGSFEIVPLCDGWTALPLAEEVPGRDVDWDAERRRYPWAFPPDGADGWAWHVHAFLLRSPEGLVLIDTGIGHLGPPRYDVTGRIDDELWAVGVAVGGVDHVVYTHLHADHSGGACRPDGTARFPNARHHVHPADWMFFGEPQTPPAFTGRFAMTALEEFGVLDFDPEDREIVAGVRVVHAPGHTPGHRVVLIHGGEAACSSPVTCSTCRLRSSTRSGPRITTRTPRRHASHAPGGSRTLDVSAGEWPSPISGGRSVAWTPTAGPRPDARSSETPSSSGGVPHRLRLQSFLKSGPVRLLPAHHTTLS